ncbi:MAG: LemA family protein, partial [Actinobacteria bacterium]|nr:LemA family protein [Actinomycetota bacterium]
MVLIIVLAGILAIILGILVWQFNKLIRYRNRVDNAWHQIDVQLNLRYDLIPRLAEVVKGYTSHEKETFENVTLARSGAVNARGAGEQAIADEALDSNLKNIIALAENYPDLKADKEFLKFQDELSKTESGIAGARKYYNGSVMHYRNACQSFPGNLISAAFKTTFGPRDYFEISEPSKRAVPA